ncbi:MAG: zinc ribbon domain-containing protein [Halobacteriaceae archaeon]
MTNNTNENHSRECTNCDQSIDPDTMYCPHCGTLQPSNGDASTDTEKDPSQEPEETSTDESGETQATTTTNTDEMASTANGLTIDIKQETATSESEHSTTDSRTIAIDIDTEERLTSETRHFNVDNIAYLKITDSTLNWGSWAVVILIPVAVLVLFGQIHALLGLVAAGVTFYGLLYAMVTKSTIKIGTVEKGHEITDEGITASDTFSEKENEFKDKTNEYICVSNEKNSIFRQTWYRYYIVPDNVASMTHRKRHAIPIPMILYILGGLLALLFFANNSPKLAVGSIIVFGVLGYLLGPYTFLDKLILSTQAESNIGFVMDREGASKILETYQSRPS